MTAVPLADQIAEVRREIAMRAGVYPTFVARNRMTQAEADRHVERMQAVLATLEWLAKNEAAIKARVPA